MKTVAFLLLFPFFPCLLIARGVERPCTVAESEVAMKEALGPPFQAWDALYKSYKVHGNCDDGIMAENYSESVARILVDHWTTLPRLASLARKDTDFRHFVLKHVDATLDMNDVVKVRTNAETQCPKKLQTLCDDLRKQAASALREDAAFP